MTENVGSIAIATTDEIDEATSGEFDVVTSAEIVFLFLTDVVRDRDVAN